ncbi:hypothetical protein JCM19379_06890 [Methyloparacoccus murrellii]
MQRLVLALAASWLLNPQAASADPVLAGTQWPVKMNTDLVLKKTCPNAAKRTASSVNGARGSLAFRADGTYALSFPPGNVINAGRYVQEGDRVLLKPDGDWLTLNGIGGYPGGQGILLAARRYTPARRNPPAIAETFEGDISEPLPGISHLNLAEQRRYRYSTGNAPSTCMTLLELNEDIGGVLTLPPAP